MNISDALAPDHILLDQSAASHDALLDLLAQAASERLGLPEGGIREALLAREALGTTGIGGGIAIPHAALAGVKKPFLMPVRLRKSVAVEAMDEAPVDLVFLGLFPVDDQASVLKLMSAVTRRLKEDDVAETLRKAEGPDEVFAALTRPETGQ
ncbi:MAG TPA: PTS sugar transporter subunit IIA [Thiolinea sp.]|nr:PTS sugar transporter subunit IIA [Thiolinea sp.]